MVGLTHTKRLPNLLCIVYLHALYTMSSLRNFTLVFLVFFFVFCFFCFLFFFVFVFFVVVVVLFFVYVFYLFLLFICFYFLRINIYVPLFFQYTNDENFICLRIKLDLSRNHFQNKGETIKKQK